MNPMNPMNPRQIDEYFKPQAAALAPEGYCLFSLENMSVKGELNGDTVVYRGWMLDANDYNTMRTLVEMQGGKLLTSVGRYLNTHHIPLWVGLLHEFTPKTVVFTQADIETPGFDLVSELRKLGWNRFFIKDFVKSLKTHGGSIVNTPEDAPLIVGLMEKFRGTIEGGLCIRRFENLYNEQRYFVVNKHFWCPNLREIDHAVLNEVMKRVDSPFYSVDIALNDEDKPRVVEIGDGQVSDLVGDWTPEFFSMIFKDLED
jgi:hypothetical protein